MIEFEFANKDSAFIGEISITRTYSNLLAGYPTEQINNGIIERTSEQLFNKTKIKPFIVEPKIEMVTQNNRSYPLLPECIISCNLYHESKLLKLPVIWLDNITEEMTLKDIISKSKIKELDFNSLAKEYEL